MHFYVDFLMFFIITFCTKGVEENMNDFKLYMHIKHITYHMCSFAEKSKVEFLN